jgi:hypothetical protein
MKDTLTHLRKLEAAFYNRKEPSVPIYALVEVWRELPKLLDRLEWYERAHTLQNVRIGQLEAAVESHRKFVAYCEDRFTWSAKPYEWEYRTDEIELKNAKDALAALEDPVKQPIKVTRKTPDPDYT